MADLVKRSPTEIELNSRDRRLVDTVVRTIMQLWHGGLLATVVAVGDYLIEMFFDGSLDMAASHHPTKSAALRHLYDRVDELPIGIHQLRIAVRVAAQWHSLPPEIADGLSVTHHEALLPLGDGGLRMRLAREAVSERLTVDALERRVRKLKPVHGGGRPATSAARRWVVAVARVVSEGTSLGRALRELGDDERAFVVGELRRIRAMIDEALDAVQGAA